MAHDRRTIELLHYFIKSGDRAMNTKLVYGFSLAFALLSLALLIVDVVLISTNHDLQDTANQRQAEINKASSLASIDQSLIQALGEVAVNENNTAMKDLLAAQGITVTAKANNKK